MAKLGFKMDSVIQLKFFFKELGKNKSKIAKVFFSIFISLLIFSSVIILKNNIETEIKKNSRVLLGGDLELSTKNKALRSDNLDKLKKKSIKKKCLMISIQQIENLMQKVD